MFGVFERVQTLGGIYHAILCTDCLNDWDAFYSPHENMKERIATNDRIQAEFWKVAKSGEPNHEEIQRLREHQHQLDRLLAVIAEVWVNDRIEREQPEPPPPPTPEELEEQRAKHIARLEARLESLKAPRETKPDA